ncbi:hypothetical protein EDB86DRAFT_3219811 [Lactarius hatsudake]|nr:hypothetical protein EDB86DRAFT_3219811 [Lactarius hatsudake]
MVQACVAHACLSPKQLDSSVDVCGQKPRINHKLVAERCDQDKWEAANVCMAAELLHRRALVHPIRSKPALTNCAVAAILVDLTIKAVLTIAALGPARSAGRAAGPRCRPDLLPCLLEPIGGTAAEAPCPLRVFAALVAATVVGVSAQSACIIDCVEQSESPSTCTSYTDLSCVCSNQAFQSASAACVNAKCTTADQQAALDLQKQNCGSGGVGMGTLVTSPPTKTIGSNYLRTGRHSLRARQRHCVKLEGLAQAVEAV